jgi:hypothetical protein
MNSAVESLHVPTRKVVGIACVITAAVAYKLYQTAVATGNYEGMWFSLAHTVLVAVGVVLALRTRGARSAE